jgi:uncharacterized protein (DUF1501 family)
MPPRPFCTGSTRRDFLRAGAASLFGMSLSLADLLRLQSLARAQNGEGREMSLIFLFLHGGMSTIDSWDMKPDAPAEFRGDFGMIDTNVPGIRVCEHMPLSARQMDKFSLIRSFRHHNSDHGAADHYMLTGFFPRTGFNPNLSPNNLQPAYGAVIARKLGPRRGVPAYVCLPKMHPSAGSAFLGTAAHPFTIDADPNAPDFTVPDIVPPAAIATNRLERRRELLNQVDRYRESLEVAANRNSQAVSDFQREAFNLMTSPAARRAFDLQAEAGRLRDEYGRTSLGQSCLMARRLVEAGVRCVTIDHSNWDTHDNNFDTLRRDLLPTLDRAIAALFRDLADRGILDRTLVVVTGEFGRTPRINRNAGRDHWGPAFTVALGGGGVRGGRVIGSTDARAERPRTDPHGPENLAATIYHLLGVDTREDFHTPEGRPMPILNGGRVINELL